MGQIIHDWGPSLFIVIGFILERLFIAGKRQGDFDKVNQLIGQLGQWRNTHEAEASKRDIAIAELAGSMREQRDHTKGMFDAQNRHIDLLEKLLLQQRGREYGGD